MARTIPPIADFASDVARALSGEAHVLYAGDYPSAAIAIGGRHPVLIRDHGWTLTVSLPTDGAWQMYTTEEWQLREPEIRQALLSCEVPVSMADVIFALTPELTRLTKTAWSVSFPGVPVPREAWAHSEQRSVGFFQEANRVRIVIGSEAMATESVGAPDQIPRVVPWLETEVRRQEAKLAADEIEAKRKAALPLPDYDAVLAHLQAGNRICTGGGRYHVTFFWDDGRLRRDIFDEGDSYVRDGSEEDLRLHIRLYPDPFRKVLGES